MGVRIRKSRNHGSPLQIDNFRFGRPLAQNLPVRPHGVNATAANCQRLYPRSFWIAGVDVSVNQNRVSSKQRNSREEDGNRNAKAEKAATCIHHALPISGPPKQRVDSPNSSAKSTL